MFLLESNRTAAVTRLLLTGVLLIAACLVGGRVAAEADSIAVIEESADRLSLRVDRPALVWRTDEAGRRTVHIPGNGQIVEAGRPVLPRLTRLVAVPAGTAPRVVSVDALHTRAIPAKLGAWYPEPAEFHQPEHAATKSGAATWPAHPARLAWQGRLRGRDVALLEVFPVRWDVERERLLITDGLRIDVVFDPLPPGDATDLARDPGDAPAFDRWVEGLVANPRTLVRGRGTAETGSPVEIEENVPTGSLEVTMDPVILRLTEAGIYRVTGAELSAAGVNLTGIDPRTVGVTHRGEPVRILLSGEDDGVFDPEDAVVFYGDSLDDRYTGTNVYWIRQLATPLRMTSRPVTPDAAPTTTEWRRTIRLEESHAYTAPSPDAQPDEHWWWKRMDLPASTQYPDLLRLTVKLDDVVATGAPFTVRFNVNGRSTSVNQPDHRTLLFFNGAKLDDQSWSGLASVTLEGSQDASILRNGSNTVRVEFREISGVPFQSMYVNWWSVEYDAALSTLNDRLAFELPPTARTAELSGFATPDVELFDVSDPASPVRLLGAEQTAGVVRFDHDGTAAVRYAVSTPTARQVPDEIVRHDSTGLRDRRNGADWIAIAPPEFAEAIEPLAALRQSEGLRTKIVLIDDVFDEFSYGIYDPSAIREFLRHAYNAWERPAPLYVLLVGDANLDYRDFMGVGNNFVPTMMTENLPTIGEVMTDNVFAQVDGDDPLPDLFVGRIPSRNVAAVELIVNRMIEYSTTPQGSDFGALLVSDDGLGAIEPAFNSLSTTMAEQVPATWNVHEIRATDYADNLSMREEIRRGLLDGALVTLYVGHGSVEIWGSKNGDTGRFWANTDVGRLPVDTMPTFAVALNCINGYFADFSRESLGEKWLMADGGGIGAWAPSGLGSLLDVELLGPELMQRFFQSEEAELGRATTMALIRAYTLHGIGEDNLEELVLLADPAQRLRLDEIAAPAPMNVGETPRHKSDPARGAGEVDGR